jgi:chromate transporter
MPPLLELFLTFAYLGVISVGGAMTIIPEMERQVVVVHGWMSHQAFVEAYALGQFAPGPNMLHVFIVGYRVAGLAGAVTAGLGMFGPTSVLLAAVARVAAGPRPPAWVSSFQAAMAPVTLGLMAAAAWTLGHDNVRGPFLATICLVAALAAARRVVDPAWIVVLAAVTGTLGAAAGLL